MIERRPRRLFDRSRFFAFSAIAAIILTTTPSPRAVAANQVVVHRVKGSVAFDHAGSNGNQVVTFAGLPDNAGLATSCSTLADLNYPGGSSIELGGSARASVPGPMDALQFNGGALYYDAHPSAGPFMVKTAMGAVSIAAGTGYIIAGPAGLEVIAVSGSSAVTTAGGPLAVPSGQTLILTSGAAAKVSPSAGVNNPALYQFDSGTNPLGTSGVSPFDPTGSSSPDCKTAGATAVTGGAAAALISLLAVSTLHGGGPSGGSPGGAPTAASTQTPAPGSSGTPGGGATATPGTGATATPAGGATTAPGATATPNGAGTATPAPGATGTIAPLTLSPSAVLLAPAVGAPAAATITATQGSYTGPFTAVVACPVNVGVNVTVNGNQITVQAPGTIAASLLCTVTVTGQGGATASAPVTITVGALGGSPIPTTAATATPATGGTTPVPNATLGPVKINPASILLAPAVGNPTAATITATQDGYNGPFQAQLTCPVDVGMRVAVSGNQVTVQAPGTVAAGLLCNVTVIGGGGMSATAPVTLSARLLAGSPSPAASGTPGASASASAAPLTISPSAVLLAPAVGQPVAASLTAMQGTYTGPFKAGVSCPVNAGVTVAVNGTQIIVEAPGTLAAAILCTVTVTGQGGATATAAVTVGLGAIGGAPAPTPAPTAANPTPVPSGAYGPLVFNPASVLLAPAVGSSAAASINVSQTNYAGPFGASLACAINEGVSVAVSGPVITVTAPNTISASVLCSVTVTGGGGATGQVPVTITAGVAGGSGTSTNSALRWNNAFGMSTKSIVLASGQPGQLDLTGAGAAPYRLDGCAPQLGSLSVNGATATFTARTIGQCTLSVRAANGAVTTIPVTVVDPSVRRRFTGVTSRKQP